MFAQSEGVNGVTGKQELGEISEDGVWLPQGAAQCKEPIPGGKQGPAACWGSLCHTDYWPL